MRFAWGVLVLVAGCVQSSSITCERDGQSWVCPSSEQCDPARVGCVTGDQLRTCVGAADGTTCSVDAETPGVCATEVCEVSRCGDGFVVAPEQCDGSARASAHSCLDTNRFYDDVPAGCNADCTYDYSTCTGYCGNGTIDGPELCDGSPPEQTCLDLGYDAGFLDCTSLCGPDFTDCKHLAWSAQRSGQQLVGVIGRDDRDVWAFGRLATVYHYDGVAWTGIDTAPCIGGHPVSYSGAVSFGGGHALVVGVQDPIGSSTMAITVDITPTGCTKTIVGGSYALRAVWGTSPADIYGVGKGLFHFDGTSWNVVHTELTMTAIWADGDNDVWAAGPSGVWRYDGTSWTPVTQPLAIVNWISGGAANDIYIIGLYSDNSTGILHWDGMSWTTIPAPAATTAQFAIAPSGTHLILGGFPGAWDYDGANWTSLDLPASYYQGVDGLWIAPNGRVFATDSLYALEMPGSVISNSSIDGFAISMHAYSPNDVVALTDQGLYFYDGVTWTADTTAPAAGVQYSTFTDVWRAPSGKVFLPQNLNGGGDAMWRWTPGSPSAIPGTWEQFAGIPDTRFMWGVSETNMWLITNAGNGQDALVQYDGGMGAAYAPCATCTAAGALYAVWGTSATNLYAVGAAGTILHGDGSAWTAMTSGTTSDLFAISGTTASDIIAVGDKVALHYDGTTWSALPSLPAAAFNGHSLYVAGANDAFASTSSGVFHFDGTHWAPVRTGVTNNVTVIAGSGDVTLMFDNANTADVVRLVRTLAW